jgi:hypothetical protein
VETCNEETSSASTQVLYGCSHHPSLFKSHFENIPQLYVGLHIGLSSLDFPTVSSFMLHALSISCSLTSLYLMKCKCYEAFLVQFSNYICFRWLLAMCFGIEGYHWSAVDFNEIWMCLLCSNTCHLIGTIILVQKSPDINLFLPV